MHSYKDRISKYTGYYKTPDDINTFKIKIRLREEIDDNTTDKNEDWYVQEFSWLEKHFSKNEKEFYRDLKNCDSDLSRIYNEKIVNEEIDDDSIFFTTTGDEYSMDESNSDKTYLEKLMETMTLKEGNSSNYRGSFEDSVISSMEHKVIPNVVEKMNVLVDLGEYIDEVWIKSEYILCTIKYEKVSKTLSVYPDFTTTKPYILRIQGESLKYVHYYIENASENIENSEEFKENDIISKVTEKKNFLIKELTGDEFFFPPKNKLFVYLFVEVLSAYNFEHNNLYVQYFIDLPEHWSCSDENNLEGATQTAHWRDTEGLVHFGHNFDVVLEYDIQSLPEISKTPKSPCIYFQIISKGSWARYRTEGLTYQNIPVSKPGYYLYNLSCYRFDPPGHSGKLRRFFIGDAYNYKDPRWIGVPKEEPELGVLNKFGTSTIGSGQLQLRLNVIHQSQAFLKEFNEGDVREKFIYEKLNNSSLIKSVNQVLVAFKKARRKMYEIKKQL